MLETRVRAQQHVSNGNGTNILIATASVTCVWSLVMRTAVCAICMAQILIHIDFIIQSSTRPQTSFLHWLKTILNGNIAPVCFSPLFCRLRMVRLRSIEWPDARHTIWTIRFFFSLLFFVGLCFPNAIWSIFAPDTWLATLAYEYRSFFFSRMDRPNAKRSLNKSIAYFCTQSYCRFAFGWNISRIMLQLAGKHARGPSPDPYMRWRILNSLPNGNQWNLFIFLIAVCGIKLKHVGVIKSNK